MKLATLFLALIAFASTVFTQTATSGQNPATKQLFALFDAEWEWTLRESPQFATFLGDKRFNTKWDDISLPAIEKRHTHQIEVLKSLAQINRAALSEKNRLNYDLFKKDYETSINEFQYRRFLLPLNQMSGIQNVNEITELMTFKTVKDYEDWIARLNSFPVYMAQTIMLMRGGMKEKILHPKVIMNRVTPQIEAQIVDDAAQSTFFAPFKSFPQDISEADKTRLTNAAKEAISKNVVPGYQNLREFFVKEYIPASFDEVGIWQTANGQKAYAALARKHTTTNLTPAEIHEKGLAEVARIRAAMEKIKTQVGFKGTLPEFFQYLRTDEKFFYKTPEELLNAYRALAKSIDPNLVKVFRTLPRTPYGVVPISANSAPTQTTAYYNQPAADGSRPGYYYVNLYRPEVRPKWEMTALSLHESVPGHHLQLALQQELGELPNFRKFAGYTAFVEGWGLYAESLGEEMGMYENPYDKFGQLTYEMWRAVRLVVDTGMHEFHWSRQRAIDYFKANAAKTDQDITNEIDRYIADPGQALAYKIGELKIKELRAKSKKELGDKFDIREFHDIVLLSGALPLDILERNINEWLAKKKII